MAAALASNEKTVPPGRAAFHLRSVAQKHGTFHVLAADSGPAILDWLVAHPAAMNNTPFSPHALSALVQAITHLARSDGTLTERLRIADHWLTRVRPADVDAELWVTWSGSGAPLREVATRPNDGRPPTL